MGRGVTNHDCGAPAIELSAVTFRHPDGRLALDGVDLSIRHGERVAVLGPNGAGKTTLALHLNGVYSPTSGTVFIDGVPISTRTLGDVRRKVGIVFQDPDDQLFMPTVRSDVAFGPANFGVAGDALPTRVEAALRAVGMANHGDRTPHHLSYGERRRVAVASVLACEPEVLVLDEPSANLDPWARRELVEILHSLTLTIVLVTHDLPYALQICSRAVVLNAGKVVADGPITTILGDAELLAANRLELPHGFDVDRVASR
jgi:cobalt/nickel transport system ATP-binding protein